MCKNCYKCEFHNNAVVDLSDTQAMKSNHRNSQVPLTSPVENLSTRTNTNGVFEDSQKYYHQYSSMSYAILPPAISVSTMQQHIVYQHVQLEETLAFLHDATKNLKLTKMAEINGYWLGLLGVEAG